jgi:hypothetical protein
MTAVSLIQPEDDGAKKIGGHNTNFLTPALCPRVSSMLTDYISKMATFIHYELFIKGLPY